MSRTLVSCKMELKCPQYTITNMSSNFEVEPLQSASIEGHEQCPPSFFPPPRDLIKALLCLELNLKPRPYTIFTRPSWRVILETTQPGDKYGTPFVTKFSQSNYMYKGSKWRRHGHVKQLRDLWPPYVHTSAVSAGPCTVWLLSYRYCTIYLAGHLGDFMELTLCMCENRSTRFKLVYTSRLLV